MKFYRLTDIKLVCESIYKRKISDRTWRRWKSLLALDKYSKFVSEQNMEQLLTLANMKRSQPYDKITLTDIVKFKLQTLLDFQETRKNYTTFLLPDTCTGVEIPNIIKLVTGRKLSKKTLYRKSVNFIKPYSTNKNYSKNELEEYISLGFVGNHRKKVVEVSASSKP